MGFEFSEKKHVEIRGKMYRLEVEDVNFMTAINEHWPKILTKLEDISKTRETLAPYSAKLNDPNITKEEKDQAISSVEAIRTEVHNKLIDALDDMKFFIKGCLETGSYEEIFAGMPDNVKDHIDLCTFIVDEAYSSRKEVIETFLKPVNREQKRAANKKKKVVEDAS